MKALRIPHPIGWRVWALGILAMGLVALAVGDFDQGQPVPKDVPARMVLAYAADAFMVAAALAVQWRRLTAWAAGALFAWYALVVVLLLDGRSILRHAALPLAYTNTAGEVALTAAALIVFASFADIDQALARRLARIGRVAFGVCAILFGLAHFLYMDLTAPIVPAWLPPSQLFWGYATGVFHILGGIAILTGVQARLAAILLAVMYAAFTPLVHIPLLLGAPHNHFFWGENAHNLALVGVAWVVADSLWRAEGKAGLFR